MNKRIRGSEKTKQPNTNTSPPDDRGSVGFSRRTDSHNTAKKRAVDAV